MSATLQIGSAQQSPIVRTVSVTLGLGQRSRMRASFRHATGMLPFQTGQSIDLLGNGIEIFSGQIQKRQVTGLRNKDGRLVTTLEATGLDIIADREHFSARYENMRADDIAADIVAVYLQAWNINTTTSVEPADLVGLKDWRDVRLSHALDDLADEVGFYWDIVRVAGQLYLLFKPYGTDSAPFVLDDANNKRIVKLSWTDDLGEYANRVKINGQALGQTPEIDEEAIVADGQSQLKLRYRPAKEPASIKVNDVPQTIGQRGNPDDESKDVAHSTGDPIIDFRTPLTLDDDVDVRYVAEERLTIIDERSGEVTLRKAVEGGTGRHERILQTDHRDLIEMGAVLEASLRRFSVLRKIVQFETYETGWKPGQKVIFDLSRFSLSIDAIIVSVSIEGQVMGDPRFDVRDGASKGWHLKSKIVAVEGEPAELWNQRMRRTFQRAGDFEVDLLRIDQGIPQAARLLSEADITLL